MTALWAWLNKEALWLFLGGVALAALWHLLQWRRDTASVRCLQVLAGDTPVLRETPRVSVLVAAWNEAEMIQEHIVSFLRLQYPNTELILCAGGEDGTGELARQHAGERVVVLEQQPGDGKQGALRRCLGRATGDIVFLTDADCLLDDDAFARTLAPLLLHGEDAATGASRPLVRQLGNPFVVHLWCANLFADARRPEYVAGALGRNCAVTREALDCIGGFDADVPTGTDYHMAKRLLQEGYRIRYVRDSAVQTRYPESARDYWRRQSRWVRNLMVHGPTFGARDQVAQAIRTSLVGLAMLALPFAAIALGPLILAAWGALLAAAFLAKLRYARYARLYQRVEIQWKQIALTPVYLFADFIAWGLPLIDLLLRRERW